MELITIVKDILVGLSAIFLSIIAFLGLNTWRKEIKGKSEYQLAKNVLKSVYNVRDAFNHVRNPGIFQYEYPDDMCDSLGHLKKEFDYAGTSYVYEKRWEKLIEAFKELEEHHLNAQVEWGSEFQRKIIKIRKCKTDLMITIQQMLLRRKNPNESKQIIPEEASKERSILYLSGDDTQQNEFTLQIREAINEFEEWLRPYIQQEEK